MLAQARPQGLDEIAIEFDDIELANRLKQTTRDSALAWANLHQAFAGLGGDGRVDALDDHGVMKKVLAEPFAWLMFHGARVLSPAASRQPPAASRQLTYPASVPGVTA